MSTRALQIECLLDPVIDHNTGDICSSGYTAYFYAAGTSTAKNVWTEKEKTNPFTSYAIGSDGTIQLYGDGVYKIVITDIDSDTIHEWDNVKIEASNFNISSKAAAYTVVPDDDLVLVDTDSDDVTISLQPVANFTYPVIIKNTGDNEVTVDPDGSETIDGAATITLSTGAHTTLFPNTSSGLWHRTVDVTVFEDADGDTKIQTEETADEDIIRFDLGDATLTSAAEIMTLQAIDTTSCKLEPTTDDKLDLGSATKQFRNAYIDGVAFVDEFDLDGTYQAAFPTEPSAGIADSVIMIGNANTIVWFYLNTAPPGWKVLTTGADTVLAVAGGTGDYNVNGGNPDSAASWAIDGLTNGNQSASHTHTLAASGTVHTSTTANQIVISGGKLYTYTTDGTSLDGAGTTTGNQSASHSHTITEDGKWRPAASIGRLFQLNTAT